MRRPISLAARMMFAELEHQIVLEAERQRAIATSNDTGTGAQPQPEERNNNPWLTLDSKR